MSVHICLTMTPEGVCYNCGDEGILLRGEEPIKSEHGNFCSIDCLDEYHELFENDTWNRTRSFCLACGFDNWEHDAGCIGPHPVRRYPARFFR